MSALARWLMPLVWAALVGAVSRQHEHGERAHRQLVRGTAATCKRVCTYRVENPKTRFDISKLRSDLCSHLVLSSADIELTGEVRISDALHKAIEDYRRIKDVRKPAIIMSVGAESSERVWRRVVQSSAVRKRLVSRLAQLYQSLDVDGIQLDWLQGAVTARDSFAKLFHDLRHHDAFPEFALLTASITAESTTKDGYDMALLNATASFILVEGSRVQAHEADALRGLRRPEPKGTVESLALEWEAFGVPKSKLVLGYAVATPATLGQEDECKVAAASNESSASVAAKPVRGIGLRAFAVHAGVAVESSPVDGRRAMRERTQWASSNKFGGIALRGIENDAARCPAERAFPVLKAVADAQFC